MDFGRPKVYGYGYDAPCNQWICGAGNGQGRNGNDGYYFLEYHLILAIADSGRCNELQQGDYESLGEFDGR